RLPPVGPNALGDISVSGAAAVYATAFARRSPVQTLPEGDSEVGEACAADSVCTCAGISVVSKVTEDWPPCSPRSYSDRPGPCPGCSGVRPCRSGKAKLLWPLPP